MITIRVVREPSPCHQCGDRVLEYVLLTSSTHDAQAVCFECVAHINALAAVHDKRRGYPPAEPAE